MKSTLASLALAFLFLITPANAWSLKEAHTQANTTLVEVGDWCSGTVISKDLGLVVTAAHCMEPAQETHEVIIAHPDSDTFRMMVTTMKPIKVTISNFDPDGTLTGTQTYMTVMLKAVYPSDVAILQNTSQTKFTSEVKINPAPVSYGDKVYAVGNPLMVLASVAEGAVLKPKYDIPTSNGVVNAILFTAFMAPGSSGGGLFNDAGELIGLTNWAKQSGSPPYAASPAQNILDVLDSLGLRIGS